MKGGELRDQLNRNKDFEEKSELSGVGHLIIIIASANLQYTTETSLGGRENKESRGTI
jgi:hypothetical protein